MHTISLEHSNKLKVLLGIKQTDLDPVPDEVLDYYWFMKRAADRISMSFGDAQLLQVAMKFQDKVAETEPDFRELVREAGVKPQDIICVKWRNRWKPATFRGFKANFALAIVEDDDTGETREFTFDKCKLVEKNEAA